MFKEVESITGFVVTDIVLFCCDLEGFGAGATCVPDGGRCGADIER